MQTHYNLRMNELTKIISSSLIPSHEQKAGVVFAKCRLEASFFQPFEKFPRSFLNQMALVND